MNLRGNLNLFYRLIGHDKFQFAAFYDVVVADERGVEDFTVQFNLFDVFVGCAVILCQDFEYTAFYMNKRFVNHWTAQCIDRNTRSDLIET